MRHRYLHGIQIVKFNKPKCIKYIANRCSRLQSLKEYKVGTPTHHHQCQNKRTFHTMTSLAVVILIVLRLVEAIHSAPLPNNQGTRETGSNEEWPSGRFDTDFFDDTVVVTFVNSCRGSEQKVNISSTQKDCINLTKSDSRVVEIKIEPFDFISLTVFDQEGCNGVGFSINKSSHSLVSGNPALFTPASFKINRR